MNGREKAIAISGHAIAAYFISGLIVSADYYLRHLGDHRRDMFGTKGAFLIGGLLALALCVGSLCLNTILVVKKKDTFRRAFTYSLVGGLISGVLASVAILAFDPAFTKPRVFIVVLVLTALPALARFLMARPGHEPKMA